MKDLFAVEGISDYMVKPLEADKLFDKIKFYAENPHVQMK